MNLNNNPTIEELRELIRSGNDWSGNHVLWVTKTGDVELSTVSLKVTGMEFQKAHPDMQMRVETFQAGKEFVGGEAADNQEWTSDLFDRLRQEWTRAKGKPHVEYIDITGARWESKIV